MHTDFLPFHDAKASAQTRRLEGPCVGTYWRHYKGGEYIVLGTAVLEATLEPCVVYRSLAHGFVWVRTLANWQEAVTVDGVTRPRFTLVSAPTPSPS